MNWIQKHNRLPLLTNGDKLERSLGLWCIKQRKKFRNHETSDYQIKLLETIPRWYWSWDNIFTER